MAGFKDCLLSALRQGAISQQDYDTLSRRFDAHQAAIAAMRRQMQPFQNAAQQAQQAMLAQQNAINARARRLAQLGEDVWNNQIDPHLQGYRNPKGLPDIYEAGMRLLENFGFSGVSSVTGRARAILDIVHGELQDTLRAFERNFYTGMRHQTALATDVVKELLLEPTGNAQAAAFARGIADQFEKLRLRFNDAGGDIAQIQGGYIPQFHDPIALTNAGFEKWRDDITPRLDPARMYNPLTGQIGITPQQLQMSLKPAYDNIRTEGWATRDPSRVPVGEGAIANQRLDHRFFVFKDAESWQWYNEHYGHGDPMKAIFGHFNSMARDIAAMEILGPNPGSTVEKLKQTVLSEWGKKQAGDPQSLFTSGPMFATEQGAGKAAAEEINNLWYLVRGRETIDQGMANFFGDVRNVLTSVQLGSAVVSAATTDPAFDRMARRALGMAQRELFGANVKIYADTFAQMPIVRNTLGPVIDFFTGQPREQALRAGMAMDEFLHILGDQARYAGTLSGNFWSRWLADRTVTLTGLEPITHARRAVFQLDLMGHIADNASKTWDQLLGEESSALLRRKMEGYGFDQAQWNAMRRVPQYTPNPGAAGILRPIDVAPVDRDLGERLAEMVSGETERAVPTGTLRSKAYALGANPKGTLSGELRDSFLQYKAFGLSAYTLQLEAMQQEVARTGSRWSGANYAAQIMTTATLGGALAIQVKAIANGKDPQDATDPKFWLASMAAGGGMGIMGDFMFADVNRYGFSFAEQAAGPTASLIQDVIKFTMGNMAEVAGAGVKGLKGKPFDLLKETQIGHEATQLLGKYTPFLTSALYTRLVYRREFIDQIDYLVDPKAHKRWREQENKMAREKGHRFWWAPGQTAPARAPELVR